MKSLLRPFYCGCFLLTFCTLSSASPPVEKKPKNSDSRAVGEFVPDGGYARTTKLLFLRRRLSALGGLTLAPGQRLDLAGTRSIPVVLVSFKNVDGPFPATRYQDLLFANQGPTMSQYYSDISEGKFQVNGHVAGWFKAPQDDTVYEGGQQGLGTSLSDLLKFGLDQADQSLDFGQFDNDGPDGIPNSGDDDGKVDTVFFIHPEHGSECDEGTNIWSHSFQYSRLNGGGPYITKDVQKDQNGQPRLNPNGTPKRITIDDYTIQPGLACDGQSIIDIGVFCHEYGHALGLPDFYDRTPRNGPDSEGVGNYCLMAGGSYGGDGRHAARPTEMSAFGKYYLGWANPRSVTLASIVDLEPADDGNDAIRLDVPGTNNLEYFLVEYRRNGPVDGKINWDEFLPASGLAVWHVDERVGAASPDWPFAPDDQGQNDSPVRLRTIPPPIFRPRHPLLALIQADRKMNLEGGLTPAARNRGDVGDLFGGGTFGDDPTGIAGSRAYDGAKTGIELKNIRFANQIAQADLSLPIGGNPIAPVAAPPVLAPNRPGRTRFLTDLEERLHTAPDAKLTDAETERIAEIPPGIIANEVKRPRVAQTLLEASNAARTMEVGPAAQTKTPVEQAAAGLAEKGSSKKPVQIQLAPGKTHAQYVAGLSLESKGDTVVADAERRIKEDQNLKRLLGVKGNLARVDEPSGTVGSDRPIEFQQHAQVKGENLPVFSASVHLHYDNDRRLVAATSTLPTAEPQITGDPASLTPAEAKSIAVRLLGVPETLVSAAEPGVYLLRGDGASGRVVYRCHLAVGENQKPIEVFVDTQTRRAFIQ